MQKPNLNALFTSSSSQIPNKTTVFRWLRIMLDSGELGAMINPCESRSLSTDCDRAVRGKWLLWTKSKG